VKLWGCFLFPVNSVVLRINMNGRSPKYMVHNRIGRKELCELSCLGWQAGGVPLGVLEVILM
jgi:hypothetical protein